MAGLAKNMKNRAVVVQPDHGISFRDLSAGATLLAVGRFQMAPGASDAAFRHTHPVWLLEMIVAGRIALNVENSGWRSYCPDQGILYAPHTRYRERLAAEDGVCKSVGVFFTVPRREPFRSWYQGRRTFFRVEDCRNHLRPIIESLLTPGGHSQAGAIRSQGYFLQLLAHLLEAHRENRTLIIEPVARTDLLSEVHRYAREHLDNPPSLADLAKVACLSKSGFAHAYKRMTGRSPIATLRQMRVEAVKAHIYRNRLTLKQIRRLTGFADVFHLSRTFKRLTGMSPRAFRSSLKTFHFIPANDTGDAAASPGGRQD